MAEPVMLNDRAFRLTAKLMDVAHERQRLIAHNLANANTPGYIRRDVLFRDELKQALAGGEATEISRVRTEVVDDLSQAPGRDGNNVVVPEELNAMMQNSMFYELMSKAFSTRLNILKSAIH